MKHALSSALGLAFLATPALADLTAEQVLADHLNMLGGYGLLDMKTTSTTGRPDGLTVEGFVGTYSGADAKVEVRTPGMVLTELDDGSVSIAYADTLPITIHVDPTHDAEASVTLTLETTGLTHVVSGTTNDLTHAIAFDTLSIGEFKIDPPEAAKEIDLSGDIALAGFQSVIRLANTKPAKRSVDLSLTGLSLALSTLAPTDIGIDTPGTTYDAEGIGRMTATILLSNLQTHVGFEDSDLPRHNMRTTLGRFQWDQNSNLPAEDGGFGISASGTDMALSYDLQIDPEALEADFLQAMLDGQRMSGALNYGSFAYDFDIATPEGSFVATTTSGASENRFSLSRNGLTLFSASRDVQAELAGPAMDIPITSLAYGIENAFVDLALPVAPSETPQPFHLRLAMNGLSVDDPLWDLFDPDRRLPRTPAELAFDLGGSTVLYDDPFTDDSDPPIRNTTARLDGFRLGFAGATVSGSGAARETGTPDNPSGAGNLDMTLTGINTLIDTLVDMGLLPSEQAMGARMGLGLIATPGDAPDTLVSRIEVNEEGQIFANGLRIK